MTVSSPHAAADVVPYRMSAQEIAWGWVRGAPAAMPESREPAAVGTPLAAFAAALLPALSQPPCVIEFSGGRDSSVVLAVACALARRHGFDPPVAFTRRYGDLPEADERKWQEEVAAFVELEHWERVDIGNELDLLGPAATASLQRYGVIWPPLVHTHGPALAAATGGSLLTGEGGDEILGPHRLGGLHVAGWSPTKVKSVVGALAPTTVRRRHFQPRLDRALQLTWLQPEARRQLVESVASEEASRAIDWRRAISAHPHQRAVRLGMATIDAVAADHGVQRFHPFLDAGFIAALGQTYGWRGIKGRTEALVEIFGSLLPDAVLRRRSKARFNRAVFNDYSRAFVAGWNGTGVDPELVDAQTLANWWRQDEPHALTFALLQACWLAERD